MRQPQGDLVALPGSYYCQHPVGCVGQRQGSALCASWPRSGFCSPTLAGCWLLSSHTALVCFHGLHFPLSTVPLIKGAFLLMTQCLLFCGWAPPVFANGKWGPQTCPAENRAMLGHRQIRVSWKTLGHMSKFNKMIFLLKVAHQTSGRSGL